MSSVTAHLNLVSLAQFDIDREIHHRKLRQQEIIDEIDRVDDELCSSFGRVCPQCREVLHAHSKTKGREVWTRAGAVVVSLKRLRCANCTFLTTPAQKLIEGGLLSSLAEVFIELCRKNTFRDARHLLNKLLGIDIPVMTLHRFVRAQSEHFDNDIVTATKALFESGEMPRVDVDLEEGKPLYLAIDEGLVRDWEWHHRKDKSENTDKKRSFVTAYCAVFFDGRELISGPGANIKRYALTNRYAHASATTSIDEYFKELVTLSIRRGLSSKNQLFILTDGAKYLSSAIETYFPHAIHLLDIFHLKKRIKELIGEKHSLFEPCMSAVHAYSPEKILKLVKACPIFDERAAATKEELITYIKRNTQIIKNHRHPNTRVHGSAAAEKSVDLLVARRFKNRGMSWTEPGCEVLLYFQVLAYNKSLDAYWRRRHESVFALLQTTQSTKFAASAKKTVRKKQKGNAYYHQVRLIDCERTKGTNTTPMAASHQLK